MLRTLILRIRRHLRKRRVYGALFASSGRATAPRPRSGRSIDSITRARNVQQIKAVLKSTAEPVKPFRTQIILMLVALVVLANFINLTDVTTTSAAGTATPAVAYGMQTGYYMGNGSDRSISGLGFSPDLVIIKSDAATTATIFKTTAMPENTVAYLGAATADSTAGLVRLDADGFTVTSTANTALVRYTWTAFTGDNCSASGQFCVGSYTGDGAATKNIITGFQPDLVWVKLTTAVNANWRSSAMPANAAQFFSATTQDTAGGFFTSLNSNGFTVAGTASPANNVSAGVYRYVAFKNVSGSIGVGTYNGNATDNTAITGVGFQPGYMFIKNANAGTAVAAVSSQTESYGDNTSLFSAAANLSDSIQSLDAGGFTIGTNSTSNGTGNLMYWAAFGGAAAHSSSGTFKSTSGTYTGNTFQQAVAGYACPFPVDRIKPGPGFGWAAP